MRQFGVPTAAVQQVAIQTDALPEIEQLIRDMNYWNGLPHNQQYTPMDVEPDRLLLAYVRRAHAAFVAQNPRPER